ncbi:MAG: rRNA adenine dimethyltransferase family protein [Candidatus Andersenbacteria bacterium]|nr:rRNA adenine dimethyltransferase family protein [bacterium]MDZ4225659.1 rRNA adenine dimethyltransferase family protein [Candidatus Andersenbacteria bacterium]
MLSLTDINTLKRLIKEVSITPTRASGQNFLICDEPIKAIVGELDPKKKQVTELGAGIGPLTMALLDGGWQVRAIERDEKLADLLKRYAARQNKLSLKLEVSDLRYVDWTWGRTSYQLVGNIPYNLSGLILRRITQLDPAPERAVLMVQKEVAERITTEPPNMSLVGLAIQLWGRGKKVTDVPSGCFWPEPEVRSAVILLEPKGVMGSGEREKIIGVAKTFFQHKRKQMGGVLVKSFGFGQNMAEDLLKKNGLLPTQRPQELSVKQWRRLASEIDNK